MAVDHIRYDLLTQQALRGVVRSVLTDAARKGLPGDHHFYVSFDTTAPGVRLSQRLRAQHPEEMTIILQHQFWDLVVDEDGFEVGLSFGGIPERIGVPFEAIKGFFDPSVQFGLQFETGKEEADAAPTGDTAPSPSATIQPAAKSPARPDSGAADGGSPVSLPANPAPSMPVPVAGESVDSGPDKPAGGEVVRLDRFRKKT
jgi:uncharacterized protein